LRAEEEQNRTVSRTLLDIESHNPRERQGADLVYGDKRSAFATERLIMVDSSTEEPMAIRKSLTQAS